jgi:hypothetical protein
LGDGPQFAEFRGKFRVCCGSGIHIRRPPGLLVGSQPVEELGQAVVGVSRGHHV